MSDDISSSYERLSAMSEMLDGISIDFGTSLVKAVFVDQDDKATSQTTGENKQGKMRLLSGCIGDVEEMMDLIEKNWYLPNSQNDKPLNINVTGANSAYFLPQLHKRFDVKANTVEPIECFVKAFFQMCQSIPDKEFLHVPSLNSQTEVKKYMLRMYNFGKMFVDVVKRGLVTIEVSPEAVQQTGKLVNTPFDVAQSMRPFTETHTDTFPCILAILGSSFYFVEVHQDGSFIELDRSTRSGNSLMGLCSLLLGTKTYQEVIDLIGEGDFDQLHLHISETVKNVEDNAQSVYTELVGEINDQEDFALLWGKPSSVPGPFKREDIAAALAQLTVLQMVDILHQHIMLRKVKHVFFSGSFVNSEEMRTVVWRDLMRKVLMLCGSVNGEGLDTQVHFIRLGSYLGAIGAMIQ